MLPPLLLLGVGFSLGLLRMNELVLGLLPASLAGSAAALAATLGRIGANLGQVLGGEILLVVSTAALTAQLRGEGLDEAQAAAATDALSRVVAQGSVGVAQGTMPPALSELLGTYVEAYTAGYTSVMRAVALTCLLTAILAWVGLRPAAAGAGNTGDLGKLSTEDRAAGRV